MAEMKVRGIDPAIKKKINSMAKQKNMSENAFVCAHLERIALQENVFQEEKNRIKETLLIHANAFAAFAKSNEELQQKVGAMENLLIKIISEEGEL
ncbi:hypothetical protein [Metasolibacillus sp.]|uniref:hypothetical protein n=1 Tax=Metasolibacillus sp. TaxID=2703680 RepID=UPI0025D9C553|nr:hypothetical protein [Metasolibacillus sp.]MCT6922823.1 hypothetical protein [Metasolibacillus sp.]MCT6938838.1 hypothetical protein [Metasolibacillus sp.]